MPELRAAIIERVAAYNAEPFQKRPGSKAGLFAAEEQPLLTGLPAAAYEISRWAYGRRVGRNGHVVWERNYYSVPFANIGTTVDLRITDRVIQAYRGTERLTSHLLLVCDRLSVGRFSREILPNWWLVSCQKSAKNQARRFPSKSSFWELHRDRDHPAARAVPSVGNMGPPPQIGSLRRCY